RCERCENVAEQVYRCVDCFLGPMCCQTCLVSQHRHNSLHGVQVWDRGFWHKESLANLGLTLNLGHDGRKCPVAFDEPRRLTVVHSHGIHELRMRFCACLDDELEGTPDSLQLIANGMWPGTWDKPLTAFTIDVMKEFHLLSLQVQMSAQDFHRYLQRRTDNVQTDQVPNRYRELLRTMQEFIWVRAVKRTAQKPARRMAMGSLAVLCPACPQPGVNMNPAAPPRRYDQR
ncbi:hypothetical protein CERSUDRAFT_57023, partial [Gelatoporia subvermispora B]